MRHPVRLLVAALATIALLAAAPARAAVGPAGTVTPDSSKAVTTALSTGIAYDGGTEGAMPVWSNVRLSITRNGLPVLTKQVLPTGANISYFKAPVLVSVDLSDDGDPEVIVDLYTSAGDGARESVIYRHTGATYTPTIVDWGTTPYALKNVIGGVSSEFVTTDRRVPAAFGGGSTLGPLRVLTFDDGTLRDATSKAKKLLAADSRTQKRALAKAHRGADPRAPLAAYVADLLRLKKPRLAKSAINRAAARKQLRGATAGRFAKSLEARLIRWGYEKRRQLR